MPKLSWNEIQDRATEFTSKWADVEAISSERGEAQTFWSDFLHVFGIDRRRHGAFFEYAIKKGRGSQGFIDMFWPAKLLAEHKAPGSDLDKASIQAYEYLETMPDHDLPHAIVLSDFTKLVFIEQDGKNEKVEFSLEDFPKHIKLFGFLIDQSSKRLAESDPVNVKAAEAMARLHNQLRDDNYTGHDLEVLLVRLVFCMFADDSGIFDHQSLREFLEQRTSDDGSDLGPRLMQVFQALNTPPENRQSSLDEAVAALPYVNGGLFAEAIRTPYFNSQMRRDIIDAMKLDWSTVSPAIFGSMFQGVMDKEQRRNLGTHYTSEKNILRVIKPLFLDDLYDEFAAAMAAGPRKKYDELRKLQDKIAGLKFLDPACGSGNFLVITYRELRRLEHKIVAQLAKNPHQQDMFATGGQGIGSLKVNVDQMYGIEIDEFPSLIATAALWLTDHQMNMEFSRESGRTFKRLPLTHSATIVNANALTTDWAEVVTPNELDFILGNPPFIGSKMMTKEMRKQLLTCFRDVKGAGVLDFVTAWYAKATELMKQNPKIQTALVSTNSIIQGEQVPILWKYLFTQGIKINFLHQTFKWSNDAKGNAAVYCTIVGFALFDKNEKQIFEYSDIKGEPIQIKARNINGYGIDAPSIFIEKRTRPICAVPRITKGNQPTDGGNLILSKEEKEQFILENPDAKKFVKKLVGAKELIHNLDRYCLWLPNANPSEIAQYEFIRERVRKTKEFRQNQGIAKDTIELAAYPTLFRETRNPESFIAIPSVSSERREYVPYGFFDASTIATNLVLTIPDATKYHFGILTSQMHMAWMRAVAGRLESRYRYSKDIVYNNFIWPEATDKQKTDIEKLAQAVLDARAEFPDSSLADLYDPLTMPLSLAKAHKALDRAVDRLYDPKGFASDTDRVAHLFELYQKYTIDLQNSKK